MDSPRPEVLEVASGESITQARDLGGAGVVAYHEDAGRLVVGPSLLAVAARSGRTRLDAAAAVAAFTEEPPGERTLVEGVRQLLPGHLLTYEDGRCQVSLRESLPELEPDDSPAAAHLHALHGALEEAVRTQLDASQPVCLASGGLDSSLLLALASRVQPGRVLAVTLSLEDDADAARTCDLVAELGAKHLVLPVADDALPLAFEKAVLAQETLVHGSLAVAKHLFFAQLLDRVGTVLSGAGADELLAAPAHAARRAEHRAAALDLLRPELRAGVAPEDPSTDAGAWRDRVARELPELVLPPEVRPARCFGIEVALPYLSSGVLAVASRLPGSLRSAGGVEKIALREVARGFIPAAITEAPKRPVAPRPLGRSALAQGRWRELLERLLAPEALERTAILDPGSVARARDELLGGQSPRAALLERALLKAASLVVLGRAIERGAGS